MLLLFFLSWGSGRQHMQTEWHMQTDLRNHELIFKLQRKLKGHGQYFRWMETFSLLICSNTCIVCLATVQTRTCKSHSRRVSVPHTDVMTTLNTLLKCFPNSSAETNRLLNIQRTSKGLIVKYWSSKLNMMSHMGMLNWPSLYSKPFALIQSKLFSADKEGTYAWRGNETTSVKQ